MNSSSSNIYQLLHWADKKFKFVSLVYNPTSSQQGFEGYLAASNSIIPINKLSDLDNLKNKWLFGHLSYDIKNQIENLESTNPDISSFDSVSFFEPEILIKIDKEYHCLIGNLPIEEIQNLSLPKEKQLIGNIYYPDRSAYIKKINDLKAHIYRGDIYEVNYCTKFNFKHLETQDPSVVNIFRNLMNISPMPFSSFYKTGDRYLLSASPERYIKKIGNKIISQPIKGTLRKTEDNELNKQLLNDFVSSSKEKAENTMITDLVRNDLSKSALAGTVKVEELHGIYEFKSLYQMISTISGKYENNTPISDFISDTFPMGSMTGAPKVKAMKLIEKFEDFKRGIFSGSIGYITPNGNFDFNVVIRSLILNKNESTIHYPVGSAITALCSAEDEYEEILLKAKPFLTLFDHKN